jgi:glycosyltransferase involved in cell wall biosynthesis
MIRSRLNKNNKQLSVFYVSPSTMPSRKANAIHVVQMCAAFCQENHKVTLFGHTFPTQRPTTVAVLEQYFGVNLPFCTLKLLCTAETKAINIRVAVMAVIHIILCAIRGQTIDLIISRNLYASAVLRILFPKNFVFETHQLEFGMRKILQRIAVGKNGLRTIVITKALQTLLGEHLNIDMHAAMVLADAAKSGIKRLSSKDKSDLRQQKLPSKALKYPTLVGYFGHLYTGRGIEIIESLALANPDKCFCVFGGNEAEISAFRDRCKLENLFVFGFVDPADVFDYMQMMDVLLMPYQAVVMIDGDIRKETSRWMSPMKMFEYMASGVPFISSNLPALAEILQDGENCILVDPSDPQKWSLALEKLVRDKQFSQRLSEVAFSQYEKRYNWRSRVKQLLEEAKFG